MTPITLGAWNVCTLLNNPSVERPGRETAALLVRELARYKIDIAALSETRLANEGQLTESGSDCTFFWSGRSTEEQRESGVGFAIKNQLVQTLASLPRGINDRLMSMQLDLHDGKHAALISAYAPTLTKTGCTCWSSARLIISSSPTQSFACPPERKHHGCILVPSTGISLIASLSGGGIGRMSE